MNLDHKDDWLKSLQQISNSCELGILPPLSELCAILACPHPEWVFPLTTALREKAFGNRVHFCTIINAKSGSCTEDCSYCSQSQFHDCEIEKYPLLNEDAMKSAYDQANSENIQRVSLVTSGRSASALDCLSIAKASLKNHSAQEHCASLGILKRHSLNILKKGGVQRYHHNLETASSFFPNLCTTHSYEERIETIKSAQAEGMSICSGGLFGVGESDEHIVELALALRELKGDAVPINFFVKVRGTRCQASPLDPHKCLLIISLFRILLPQSEIIICGGRQEALKDQQRFIFSAGASGMMTGNYLTTKGTRLSDDIAMVKELGLEISPSCRNYH